MDHIEILINCAAFLYNGRTPYQWVVRFINTLECAIQPILYKPHQWVARLINTSLFNTWYSSRQLLYAGAPFINSPSN
jgi:hypothetical protein